MDIKNFYVGEGSKPIQENSGVNVIYFTNRCNLACTYCYEDLKGRPKQVLSKDQIKNSVDIILERENPEEQTLFVLFGGEVTLEWENAVFMMEYAYSKKKNVHFNISTNGVKFSDDEFILNYKNLKFYKLGLTSLDISFDGIGNKERITHNKKESTDIILNTFRQLSKYNVEFRLRYTIHQHNINNLYNDIIMISKTIKPKRIITSVAWSTLSDRDLVNLDNVKQLLRDDWKNNEIIIPVCELFCDTCNGCGVRKEIKTYFTDEGNVNTFKNYESAPEFNDFKKGNK